MTASEQYCYEHFVKWANSYTSADSLAWLKRFADRTLFDKSLKKQIRRLINIRIKEVDPNFVEPENKPMKMVEIERDQTGNAP